MAEEIGKVSFGIEANFDDKGMKQAEQGLNGLQRAGNTAAKGISAFGVAAGTASGILAVELVKALAETALKVATFAFTVTEAASAVVEGFDKMAQATGVSVRQFQQLEPVMRKNGVSAEQMGATFRILARNIHEARDPSSQAGQAFESLGLSLTGLESPSEVLTLIADRVSKLPDGFEKTRLITELLGRSGTQLTAVLNEGAAGFKRSAEEAAKMANVLSDDANKALLEVNDTFDMLEVAQDNLSKHLAVLFAPMVQAANEARISLANWAVTVVDDITIATRTLAVRLEALFGFLKAQAQLSLSEIGKVGEYFERWDHWAKQRIEAIRKEGVVSKELGNTIGTVDEKAQAAARASVKAAQQASFGLQQVDIGWKIVQPLIDAYRKSQEALGRYITTQLISAYQELQQASGLWAKADFDAANRNIAQFKALEAQYRATAEASNRAALASGGITPVEFEQRSGALALQTIDQEIAAQQQRIAASNAYYASEIQRATDNSDKQRELIQQHIADVATANNAIAVLEQQRVTQSVVSASAVTQANTKAYQDDLAAKAATAQAEVGILQASFAETDALRDAQLNAINARLAHELSTVDLTEQQKIAIYRRAEAERMNIARQFPTFFQKQMQDLVAGNAFSLSQITSNFTNAAAQWIVTGKGFEQFWKQLQVTVVQAFLNSLIQMAANFLLKLTVMEGAATAFEAAKTAIFGSGEAARAGIAKATSTVIAASTIATMGAMVALGEGSIAIMAAVMLAASAMLAAIATALDLGVVTAPLSAPVWAASADLAIGTPILAAAGSAAIQGAAGAAIVAMAASGGFAKGGIGDFGQESLATLHGKEAIIPLNERGAGFMADMLGLGAGRGGRPQQIVTKVYLDKRQIALAVSDEMPSALRRMGVPA